MRKILVEIKDRRQNLVETQDRGWNQVFCFDKVWFEFYVKHLGVEVMQTVYESGAPMAIQYQGCEDLPNYYLYSWENGKRLFIKVLKKRKGDPKLDSKNTSMYTNDCGILEPEKIYALIFN